MTITRSRVVEVCKNIPTTFIWLLYLIVTALDRLLSPGVEVRHPIVSGTIHAWGRCSTPWKPSGSRGIEKRGGRVTAGSGF